MKKLLSFRKLLDELKAIPENVEILKLEKNVKYKSLV